MRFLVKTTKISLNTNIQVQMRRTSIKNESSHEKIDSKLEKNDVIETKKRKENFNTIISDEQFWQER